MTEQQGRRYEALRRLAASYVPEWKCDPGAPDAGTAAAMLVEDMRADSEQRLAQVLGKHRVQYLNLFDRLRVRPAEAAEGYVQFTPVAGMQEPVQVPAGTQLLAEDAAGGGSMVFETMHGITAAAAQLAAVYETDRASDRIVCLRGREAAGDGAFRLFDFSGSNQARHVLLLAFDDALDAFSASELGLRLHTADPAHAEQAAARLAQIGHFSLWMPAEDAPDAAFAFAPPRVKGDTLWLDCTGLVPRRTEFGGAQRYVLRIAADAPDALTLTGAELLLSQQKVLPDAVQCGGVLQPTDSFAPFGRPLALYAECGIESAAVFARHGAKVEMRFRLSFAVEEQRLPEPEENVRYKIIMRKKPEPLRMETVEIKPDEVLLEYCSTAGWKQLIPEENARYLFNGTAQGEVTLAFTCPDDFVPDAAQAGGCRLRLRLVRAEGLYRVPSRMYCPLMQELSFSYRYETAGLAPDAARIENNYRAMDPLPLWAQQRAVPLYLTAEAARPCLYLGFDASPAGSPLSIYWEIENSEDVPQSLTAEYGGPRGFAPVEYSDRTEGLRYAGAMLLLVPSDCVRQTLFGQEAYWLRFASSRPAAGLGPLPLIRDIRLNMARVENRRTRTELFYVDDPDAALRCTLAEKGLLRMEVAVNECAGAQPGAEHWVQWERRTAAAQHGRYAVLDEENGTVSFEKGTFARFPVPAGAAAVRVRYESYAGTQANVAENTLTAMAQPLKYIAHVSNPLPLCGGGDPFGEEASARQTATLLRTRGRAVTEQDYFDILTGACSSVRRIRCAAGIDRAGRAAPGVVTIAVLTDPCDVGGHLFSAVKERMAQSLVQTGGLVPMGRTLQLVQPRFIRVSARIWLRCGTMDSVYELQTAVREKIGTFLDPLTGGFDGRGWEIGVLPTPQQLLAYLRLHQPGIEVQRLSLVAAAGAEEMDLTGAQTAENRSPFDLAVNGDHVVYAEIRA